MLRVYLKRLYIIKNSSVYEYVCLTLLKALRKTLKNKIGKTPCLHEIYILVMRKRKEEMHLTMQ